MCYRYKNAADGKQALEKMNGFDLAGRQVMGTTKERERERDLFIDLVFCRFQLKVGLVTERAAAANYGNLDDEGTI